MGLLVASVLVVAKLEVLQTRYGADVSAASCCQQWAQAAGRQTLIMRHCGPYSQRLGSPS
jgi:hypothetical protein